MSPLFKDASCLNPGDNVESTNTGREVSHFMVSGGRLAKHVVSSTDDANYPIKSWRATFTGSTFTRNSDAAGNE